MPRKEKIVRSSSVGARQTMSLSLLLVLLAMSFLIPIHGAHAAVQMTSGSVQLGNTLPSGSTSYTVSYSYPATAALGNNVSISLTLHVDSLNGNVEYLTDYKL